MCQNDPRAPSADRQLIKNSSRQLLTTWQPFLTILLWALLSKLSMCVCVVSCVHVYCVGVGVLVSMRVCCVACKCKKCAAVSWCGGFNGLENDMCCKEGHYNVWVYVSVLCWLLLDGVSGCNIDALCVLKCTYVLGFYLLLSGMLIWCSHLYFIISMLKFFQMNVNLSFNIVSCVGLYCHMQNYLLTNFENLLICKYGFTMKEAD